MSEILSVDILDDDASYIIDIKKLGPVNLFGHSEYSVAIDGIVMSTTIVHNNNDSSLTLITKALELIKKTEDWGDD